MQEEFLEGTYGRAPNQPQPPKISLFQRLIPGHFLVATIPEMIFLGIVTYEFSHQWHKVVGLVVFLFALFCYDQTTHLKQHAQDAHKEPAPSWIEQAMQRQTIYPEIMKVGYLLLAASALLVLLS